MKNLEYKKMLAEALGRVDEERMEFNLDLPDDDEDLPDAFLSSKKGKPAVKTAAKAVADNTTDKSKLSNKDFEKAYTADDAGEATAANDTQTAMKMGYKKEIDAIKQDIAVAIDQKNLTTDFEGTAQTTDDIEDEFHAPDINKIKSATTFEDLSQSFKKFNAFNVKAPQSMIDQFNKIDGKGLLGKFNELAAFGKAIENGVEGAKAWIDSKSEGAAVTKAASLKFMNYAAAYITYADMSKHISGNEAGYAFEKYLALLLSAPILGGSNGAVDNVAKIVKGAPVFMSAKFMAGKSVKSISQAILGKEGIEAVVKTNNRPVYYLAMAKVRGSKVGDAGEMTSLAGANKASGYETVTTSYNYLIIFLIKIAHDGADYTGDLLNSEGVSVHNYTPQITMKTNKEGETVQDKLMLFPTTNLNMKSGKGGKKPWQDMAAVFERFANGELGGFLIPTPVAGKGVRSAEQLATLTASVVSEVSEGLNNDIINKVKAIYKGLQSTQNTTRSYVAVASEGSSDANQAAKYVTDISDKYKNLFANYGGLFGDDTKDSVFGKDSVKKAMGLAEIKKLTEEILKEMLTETE